MKNPTIHVKTTLLPGVDRLGRAVNRSANLRIHTTNMGVVCRVFIRDQRKAGVNRIPGGYDDDFRLEDLPVGATVKVEVYRLPAALAFRQASHLGSFHGTITTRGLVLAQSRVPVTVKNN